jgi:alpha-glucosidase
MNLTATIVPVEAAQREWWRGAVIYQVYPRSFADSNGDGIGDLKGITSRLEHIASLGVDAVWLSPFFTSPMKDFGYDVADYCDVDPIFGTLADFDALIKRAHALGLRLLVDQVYAHTSDQHDWFRQSRQSSSGDKADWYVWADAKPDGAPPSNWQSVFGGPAWTWDARRGQYYMHNFLPSQPQLNVHLPAVQDALLDTARFWLDRGVDGFRMDAINFAMHDPLLRDNPPAAASNARRSRPFDFQQHVYNQSHADIPAFIRRIRSLTDSYGARFMVAEVGGAEADREMKLFTRGDEHFHSAYGFDFLYARLLTPRLVQATCNCWPDDVSMGWPSWAFENHDAPRAISRWCPEAHRSAYLSMKMLLLMCLRGNVFIYQGEELGLTQVDIRFEQLQDPEAIANWPMTLSRDGARTPMPWEGGALNCGFSAAIPWLPLGPDHAALAVDRQISDCGSILNITQRFVAMRRSSDALMQGSMAIIEASDHLLVFERSTADERLCCVFNMSDDATHWQPKQPDRWQVVERSAGEGWDLPAYAGMVIRHIG